MDARIKFAALAVVVFLLGADYSTKHFVVSAPDPQLAKQVALAAEVFRRDLAIQWLGHELPEWTEKCPVTVRIEPQAGGQTSFGFVTDGTSPMPVGWQMEVYGSPERILDSVLPHEVTHTIFATHFGRPLPRWADEGACTTVEHESERSKNHELLLRFLTTNRGIPFNRMFAMKQYPHDIYPLYAQGYSLARFLILQGGRKRFVDYVGAGMSAEKPGIEPRAWDVATKKFYGYNDLSELQVRWVQWVKQGCPDISQTRVDQVASAANPSIPNSVSDAAEPNAHLISKLKSDGPSSWYISQGSDAQVDESPRSADQGEHQVPGSLPDSYRPGSIRDGRPIEILATVSTASVSANRLNPEAVYFSRPEIVGEQVSEGTLFR